MQLILLLRSASSISPPAQEEDFNSWVQGLPIQDAPVQLPDASCLPALSKAIESAEEVSCAATTHTVAHALHVSF